MKIHGAVALLAALIALPGCDDGYGHNRVNGAVSVNAGEKAGDVSTVNGAVNVAPDASVGSASTVNGHVDVGAKATAASVNTVNGGIDIGEGAQITGGVSTVNGAISAGKSAHIAGSVSAVNGSVTLENDSDVAGQLSNVNGRIRLSAAHVAGGIKTVRADIEIGAGSKVENGILVQKSSSMESTFNKHKVPRIVIGPGAVVEGTLKFEREVALYVSDTATIGPVEGATAVKFSGENPPD